MLEAMKCKKAEVFKVLSVESRIRIIELLKQKGPLGVNEMSEAMGITPSAVSQHLKVLRYAGLVRSERKGYCLPYNIDHSAMAQCKELIAEVCNCGCRGTCRERDENVKTPGDELTLLKQRERELQKELKELRARIKVVREKK
ncbi:MAG: metalloregulator ArsR/SmtB family transcription factor [bacterium]